MENFHLETIIGPAYVPASSYIYVSLNPKVAALMPAAEFSEGKVFVRTDGSLERLSNPELDLMEEMLYPQSAYGARIPLPRKVIADILCEQELWGQDAEERAFKGQKLGKKDERIARNYINQQGGFSSKEIDMLLSADNGLPAEWPWENLMRYWPHEFDGKMQKLAVRYSNIKRTVQAAMQNGQQSYAIEAEGLEVIIPELLPQGSNYLILNARNSGKTDKESNGKVLTLESGGMPEELKPAYLDYNQLVEDAYLLEAAAGTVVTNYLVRMKRMEPSSANASTMAALFTLLSWNAYVEGKYWEVAGLKEAQVARLAEPALSALKAGSIDDCFSMPHGATAGFIDTINCILQHVPQDFQKARNEKGKFILDSIYSPLPKNKKREATASSIRQFERSIKQKFGIDEIKVRYIFSVQLNNARNRNPRISEAEVRVSYAKRSGFISRQEFLQALERYSLSAPETVISGIFP